MINEHVSSAARVEAYRGGDSGGSNFAVELDDVLPKALAASGFLDPSLRDDRSTLGHAIRALLQALLATDKC
jgi:hypothetical protein